MKFFSAKLLIFIASLCVSLPEFAHGQIRFSGYAGNYNAVTFSEGGTFIGGRNTIRLNLLNEFDQGRIYISGNLRHVYNQQPDSLDFRLREAYLDIYLRSGDLRIGKQPISWGITESDFIFDILSPFDLSEFITQDFNELREGVTAVSYTHFWGRTRLQAVLNPVFEPSRLPDYDGRWGVVPSDLFPVPTRFVKFENPEPGLRDMQGALRLALRPSLNFDLDLAVLYWRHNAPGYYKEFETINLFDISIPVEVRFREEFKPGLMAGFWGEYRFSSDFRLQFEAAWMQLRPFDYLPGYLTPEDIRRLRQLNNFDGGPGDIAPILGTLSRLNRAIRESDGFLTYRPSVKYMGGTRFNAWGWDATLQYVAESIINYDSEILQDQYFHGAGFSATHSFFRDNLMVRLTGRYQFNGHDLWINPEFRYSLADGLSLRTGAHVFGGPQPDPLYTHLSFARFRYNSLGYFGVNWFW